MAGLTHFNQDGQAHMVDVGHKLPSKRRACAEGYVSMSETAFIQLQAGTSKKGDVLGISRIAAIQASKQTAYIIPLCHPLALTHVDVKFELIAEKYSVRVIVIAETIGLTGVEMEALTAVMGAVLTIYDMLKAIDKNMCIFNVQLLEKSGGKSGDWQNIKVKQS